jgi:plasmid stability protein
MANVTVKNIPTELYERLKHQARSNHRSVNSEIIFTLKRVLGFGEKPGPEELINEAREFRKRINVTLSEEEIDQAKKSGRE